MAESELIIQDINELDVVSKASNSDVLILTDKASNNSTIIGYTDFVSTLLNELQYQSFPLDAGTQTIINALNLLNTRVNNIASGSSAEDVSQAEITDARIPSSRLIADGLINSSYSLLGDSIRAQINALYDEVNNIDADNIKNRAITSSKIALRSITGDLLALNGVTFDNLATSVQSRITTLEGKLPAPPSTNGTYTLTATVTDGSVTYTWTE